MAGTVFTYEYSEYGSDGFTSARKCISRPCLSYAGDGHLRSPAINTAVTRP